MKQLYIYLLILLSSTSVFAQINEKFSQEIVIYCEQVQSAKMSSDDTAYGKAKKIDITFPFRTYVNPKKGAKITIEAPGYEEYNLVIVKGGLESDYQVILTPDMKEMAKMNHGYTDNNEGRSAQVRNKFDKYSFPITIECDQVESAKLSATQNLYGMFMNFIDITFPFTDRVNPDKGAVIMLKAPGYHNFKLVIPPGTNQSHFKVHFTEDPKEMAKIRKKREFSNGYNHYNNAVVSNDGYTNANSYSNVSTNQAVNRNNPGASLLEKTIIRWMIDSDPQGARIFWRVISSIPEQVKNTNESYLLTTPYEETRSFNILGLTYENSRDVQIEIKLMKSGYHPQVKRFNVRQAIDQQEISTFFQLVPKEE